MKNTSHNSPDWAKTYFTWITSWPKTILFLGILSIAAIASFIPQLHKDTSSDAFIAKDNPVLVYRTHVKEVFGLKDPIVLAVISDGKNGIYNPASLKLIDNLTASVSELENVDPDKVMSLATEKNIVGTYDGMDVNDFFDPIPADEESSLALKAKIDAFPLYQGALVSRDDTTSLIVVELIDQRIAESTYEDIMAMVAEFTVPEGSEVHVAGEGAIAGYLSTYIDNDAKKLNPLAGLVITLVLFVAFRTLAGSLLPNLIVLGTAAMAIGSMAAFGVSFYVITNGLVTILIGISVADSIHVMSQYYEEQVKNPGRSSKELTIAAMLAMWKPITLTSITTIAGFMGLWLGADMPPMAMFGVFAAVGVAAAWLYSMTILPAALSLFNIKPSKLFARTDKQDKYGKILQSIGMAALKRPKFVIVVTLFVAVIGGYGATKVIVQESSIENFQTYEPLYIADKAINAHMDGTYFLDIVVETGVENGLFEPRHLERIAALQAFAEKFPEISGSTSVADYIKQMHKAVNENDQAYYSIPNDPNLIAQLFLLYSTSGDPTDFEEEVDYDYQEAVIRFNFPVADYQLLTRIVPEIQSYVDSEFNTPEIKATLSGRVAVNHEWLKTIGKNHVYSLGLSLLFVFLASVVVFRSIVAGIYALIPVVSSLLLVYAVMGFSGIWLGVGTNMFAAIAIGLGVDFAIHTIDRMKELLADGGDYDKQMEKLFPTTGRALFFNFAALALGFAVLMTSDVPPLIRFGLLVVTAMSGSFLSGLTVLPVLGKLFKPKFLIADQNAIKAKTMPATVVSLIGLVMVTSLIVENKLFADDDLTADEIVENVNARDDGEWVSRTMKMELIDKRGKVRVRDTDSYRRYYGTEKRTVLFYKAPSSVKGTGFLTYDYADIAKDDDQWLYLPALRKIRRISASDRGDYFLGTDLTYEDIKKEGKFTKEDYTYQVAGKATIDGFDTIILEGTPVSDKVAKELGYSRTLVYIDPEIWMPRKVEMWDTNGNALKTVVYLDIRQVDGIWSTYTIKVENLKSRHKTIFTFSDFDYKTEVQDKVFEQRNLKRGR